MSRFSEEFKAQIADSVRGLGAVSSQLATPDVLPTVLKDWFSLLWQAIRATIPLCKHSLVRLASFPDDTFHEVLRNYYRHKIEEESGHDDMMLEDLTRLGISAEELR